MGQTKEERNRRIREHRKALSEENPAWAEKMKLKEKLRSRNRRADYTAKSNRVSTLIDHRRVAVKLPRGYPRRLDVDTDIEMYIREESSNNWRAKLPQIKSTLDNDDVLGKAVASFVNVNRATSMYRYRHNQDLAFTLQQSEAAVLADQLHNTIVSSREIIDLLPHSTRMLENPSETFTAVHSWTDIHLLAVKVESHLKSRMDAASQGVYW